MEGEEGKKVSGYTRVLHSPDYRYYKTIGYLMIEKQFIDANHLATPTTAMTRRNRS